jgi:hypothetical protein
MLVLICVGTRNRAHPTRLVSCLLLSLELHSRASDVSFASNRHGQRFGFREAQEQFADRNSKYEIVLTRR